jgi:DNA-binding NarL/FixJ family response regulator
MDEKQLVEPMKILLVEDNPGDVRLIRETLAEAENFACQMVHVDRLAEALQRLRAEHFDVVLLDLSLPDSRGLSTIIHTHEQAPSVPIVVLTGLDDEALAVSAVREGAQDYLVKGEVSSSALVRCLRHSVERQRKAPRDFFLSVEPCSHG